MHLTCELILDSDHYLEANSPAVCMLVDLALCWLSLPWTTTVYHPYSHRFQVPPLARNFVDSDRASLPIIQSPTENNLVWQTAVLTHHYTPHSSSSVDTTVDAKSNRTITGIISPPLGLRPLTALPAWLVVFVSVTRMVQRAICLNPMCFTLSTLPLPATGYWDVIDVGSILQTISVPLSGVWVHVTVVPTMRVQCSAVAAYAVMIDRHVLSPHLDSKKPGARFPLKPRRRRVRRVLRVSFPRSQCS